MTPRCPGELERARALGGAADPAVAAHVAGCAACRADRDELARAIELARELPLPMPPPARREEVRTAVLAAGALAAPAPRRLPVRALVMAVAAAAAAVALWAALPAGRAPTAVTVEARGTVHARPGARFTARSPVPDEVVRLEEGVIDVQVAPLRPGERFRVLVGDAEIEVRGTAFEVAVRGDRLISVEVRHGTVEVRPRGGATALLGAGQIWRAGGVAPVPATAAAAAAEPAVAPAAPLVAAPTPVAPRPAAPLPAIRRAPEPAPAAAPREAAPPAAAAPAAAAAAAAPRPTRAVEEQAYDDAWTAMRAGDFTRAATAFTRVFILAPDGALAEDAAFWHAVALARGGRAGESITAFRDFLSVHARSARAGEASAMLGWILVERGERAEAERRFRAAIADPSPAVQRSAREGRAALAAGGRAVAP